jgi:hypothetical protein
MAQVRFAASRAARALLSSLSKHSSSSDACVTAHDAALTILLPAMCLNRYYVAEGVRAYSQETWRLVAGTNGRTLVAQRIDRVVPYYILQSKVPTPLDAAPIAVHAGCDPIRSHDRL